MHERVFYTNYEHTFNQTSSSIITALTINVTIFGKDESH